MFIKIENCTLRQYGAVKRRWRLWRPWRVGLGLKTWRVGSGLNQVGRMCLRGAWDKWDGGGIQLGLLTEEPIPGVIASEESFLILLLLRRPHQLLQDGSILLLDSILEALGILLDGGLLGIEQ